MLKNLVAVSMTVLFLSQAQAQVAAKPVPHTPPRDQGAVGFCWSYSLNGLLESEALKSGKTVTLSPEYVGFYHMYDQLKKNIHKFRAWALKAPPHNWFQKTVWAEAKKLAGEQFMTFFGQSPSEGAPNLTEPFSILATYGAVPETVYDTKIGKDHAGMEKRVMDHFIEKLQLKSTVDDFEAHPEKIREELAVVFGLTPPQPEDKFTYEGKEYTALTFVKEYLAFDSSQFQEVKVTRSNQAQVVPQILKSINDGNIVPLAFIVFNETFDTAKNTGVFDSQACPNQTCTQPAGGHGVLAVNYMTPTGAANDPMSAIIIKNSWGQTGLNEMGVMPQDKSTTGYYELTAAYLDDAFRMTTTDKPTQQNPNPTPKPKLGDGDQGYSVVLKKQYIN